MKKISCPHCGCEIKIEEKEDSSKCKAITKKGTRCSRLAGSNGFCWQHSK